jgi:hypothetical protein
MEQQTALDSNLEIVINAFKNDSVRISVQGIDGNLLYVSKKIAGEFGHADATILQNQHVSILQDLLAKDDLNLVAAAHEKAVKGEANTLIVYSSHANVFYNQINTPIWDKNGNVIAEQSVYCPILSQTAQQLYRIHYLHKNEALDTTQSIHHEEKINELQGIIIFLLLAGKTQYEIAEELNYSRSNVAKNIAILCSIFEIESKEKSLIDFCMKNGYDKFIPKQLLQRKVVRIQAF